MGGGGNEREKRPPGKKKNEIIFQINFFIDAKPIPMFSQDGRKRFEALARKLGFDPLVPEGWHSVSLPTILTSEVHFSFFFFAFAVFFFSFFSLARKNLALHFQGTVLPQFENHFVFLSNKKIKKK